MNQSLKEFKELRLIYSGRIDAAIKANDEELLYKAKLEYGEVLNKYINLACKIISNHTNKPFTIYKKTDRGIVYLSEKKINNDIKDIRESLKDIKLDDTILNDIKVSLEIVTDYYEKVIIENNVKYRKDNTQFKFQVLFGFLVAPIVLFIAAYLNGYIITHWAPNLKSITKITDFYNINVVDTKSAIFLLLILVIDFVALIILSNLYIRKSDDSIWNKKKFMLIPVGIMEVYLYTMPITFILKWLLGRRYVLDLWQITNQLFRLLLIIFICVLVLFSLLSDNFASRGYKNKLSTMDILFIIVIVITTIIPDIYILVAQIFDFPIASSLTYVNYLLLILYLGFTLYFIDYEVFTNEQYNNKRKMVVIINIVVLVISILLIL